VRPRVRRRTLVAAALLAALAAGGVGAALTAAAAPESVRLTVTFSRGHGASRIAHLRCTATRASADGFLKAAGPARACARARAIVDLLAGKPAGRRACTQIYGGPERALVTGRIGARTVRRGFTRKDGCGIADWRRAMPLLPRPG
jgi:hypothetical protein